MGKFYNKKRTECFRYALIESSWHGEAGVELTRRGHFMQLGQGAYFSFSDLSSVEKQGEIGKLEDIDQVLNVLG